MDEALVQHAQHDVDGDEGGDQQEHLARQRILEGLGGALERARDRRRQVHRLDRLVDVVDGRLSDAPSVRLNDTVTAGNCAR